MPLTAGTRLGAYEVVAALGRGGMGEVYRARDTKLGRDVAIKILPDVFLGDPDRVARFEREARTLASLSHANIAQIYGVEVDESAAGDARPRALVMELVEGQDLSEIVARGPMEMRDALAIARQIAAALETAHEAGIIHRDLKPANVKVREDGAVKVLDFGLAKALLPEASERSADAMNSPTLTARATQLGIVLGTAAYMAPEQAKGLPVDRRADVWAFGVVLYEMLTGRRLFDGPDATEMMAQVLTREPDWRVLPLETPASVQRLLARCLVKDRRQRLDSMSAARLDLDEAAAPAAPAPAPARRPSPRLTAAAFAGAGVIAGALIARLLWPAAAPTAASTDSDLLVASVIAAPELVSAFTHGFALSPDGSTLVYVARTADGKRQLWKRRLSDPRSELIAGTDDAIYPFWSPDSRHVGFFTSESIKRIAAAGGPAQTITAARGYWPRGSWSSRDEILFSAGAGIMRVAASGGRPEKIVAEGPARDPQWLPDGIHFLYVLRSRPARLFVASVDGTKPADELYDFTASDDDPGMSLSQAGFIVFNHAGVLSIRRFDVSARKLIGPVVAVGEKAGTPRSWLAVTTAGNTIVALNPSAGPIGGTPGDPVSRLQWIDRQGRVVGEVGSPGRFWTLRLSHDGLRAAVNPNDDIWTIDTRTGLRTRIAVAASTIWSHDDRQLIFRNEEGIVGKSVTGEGQTRLLAKGRSTTPTDASLNGQLVALTGRSEADASSTDVLLLTLADGSIKPFLSTPDNELQASFSPDSRWLAYTSDSTGRSEVYVRALSGDGAPMRISAEGGEHPMWRRDGRELFFLSPTDQIIAVDVAAIATGRVGARTTLFRMVMNDIVRTAYPPFAVTPDGQRFLVNVPSAPEPLTIIRNVGRLLNGQ